MLEMASHNQGKVQNLEKEKKKIQASPTHTHTHTHARTEGRVEGAITLE